MNKAKAVGDVNLEDENERERLRERKVVRIVGEGSERGHIRLILWKEA